MVGISLIILSGVKPMKVSKFNKTTIPSRMVRKELDNLPTENQLEHFSLSLCALDDRYLLATGGYDDS